MDTARINRQAIASEKKKARIGFTMRAYGHACLRLMGEDEPTLFI